MADAASRHTSVMADRCVELLVPALIPSPERPHPVYLDGTLGMGGHMAAVLSAAPAARGIGIDRDRQALALAAARLAPFEDRITCVPAVFDELDDVLDRLHVTTIDAMLLDLGVSSLQLDEAERGFSYRMDAALDMRMDQGSGQTAAELLNTASQGELTRILREYGEERFAPRIAAAIVKRRGQTPWQTTGQLVELIREVIPAPARRTGGNPAKRTFQALRVAVNDELGVLERVLPQALSRLAVGGRLVVLTFQSLEDRIVKRAFTAVTQDRTPPGLPVPLPELEPEFAALVRGGQTPDPEELASNPRSASVRLRAVERVRAQSLSAPRTRHAHGERNFRHDMPGASHQRSRNHHRIAQDPAQGEVE